MLVVERAGDALANSTREEVQYNGKYQDSCSR